ncbi:MAG: superoxide dismutase family protein [Dechloromonas sp.]|uniref:Superoxide dismutase family protein n=1 Tax=Candidatus Dechloromonas phosphorivorans TaxID=2899244 RepID=A0A935K3C3_9RHOO|nr:superoxide dismutase family protein [Candidatus Dechloromonas phosphorivorans]
MKPGPHGFHIHEKGDCSAPDGTNAGGHYNRLGKPHGNPEHADHHAGDMPQRVADAKGGQAGGLY